MATSDSSTMNKSVRFLATSVVLVTILLVTDSSMARPQASPLVAAALSLADGAQGNGDGDKAGHGGGNSQLGQTPPGVTPKTVDPPKAEVDPKMGTVPATPEDPVLRLFGSDFFAAARASIRAARERDGKGGNAYSAPTGPIALGSVFATPPESYQLGPGDRATLTVSTPFQEPTQYKLTVDSLGSIVLPVGGKRLVLRGQSLAQAQALINQEVARVLQQSTVSLTLDELRTFSVSVLGESFAPGVYQVPATFSLFNLILATGGPSSRGSLRQIQLRRTKSPVQTFDLYTFLISGEATQDIQLQPGDVVFYDVFKAHAAIEGEVARPGIFELKGEESLATLIAFAGGVRPSAVAQNIAVDSIVPGSERKLLNLNLANITKAGQTPIRDGDKVKVFSIRPDVRNAVVIEGPVEQPRPYAFRAGMTIRDLVELSLGLLPDAVREQAELKRRNSDGSQTLIRINLSDALEGNPVANILLNSGDTLRIFNVNDIAWMGERKVFIMGAVRDPGEKERSDGMRVGDLVREARGLQLDAFAQEAFLQRFNKDGSPAELIRVNLHKAALGAREHDVLLQDRDQLRVFRVSEWQATPEMSVSVTGAVQRPGDYPLAVGLRVKDLLDLAGGMALNAFPNKAYVQRLNMDGTVGPVFAIDLLKAATGDPEHNLVLQSRDRLNVQNILQAQFQVEQTVTLKGGVQRPGAYPASSNLTLRDLIDLAGGLLPDASGVVEISEAWQPVGKGVSRVEIGGEFTRWVVPDVAVPAGSIVSVFQRSDIQARPRIVTILGAVERPGAYVVMDEDERISDVVKRAGGIRVDGYPRAAEFIRNPELLQSARQRELSPRAVEVLKQVADDEYKRADAMLNLDRLRIVFSQGASISSSGSVSPGDAKNFYPGNELDKALAGALTANGVTAARAIDEKSLIPAGNLNARVDLAIGKPRGRDDIPVRDGDVIMIPIRPTSVTVSGAVLAPSSILFQPGASVSYYISRGGGATRDADLESMLIIRATGELIRMKRGVKVELGDTLVIPTKVQAIRYKEAQNVTQSLTSGITSAAATLSILRLIMR